MKILYPIIDGEISGGNIICLRIIEEALKRGYQVVVNSPTEGKLTDILKGKGARVYNIDTRCSWRFDKAIKLVRIIKKENVCLVHSHTPLSGTALSRLAGWLAGVPVITHAHTWDFMSPNPMAKCYQFLMNWFTSRFFCAQIIAVSRGVKREIIKQGVAANKITVVYNGINLDDYRRNRSSLEIRKEFGLKENQRIIGEVGYLCKDKGQHILIQAIPKVIRKIPDAVFMIVGEDLAQEGEYKDRLEDLAHSLGVKQHLIFTGYRADIMELMNVFEFFVLPSLVEGLPVVILEAMAAKKAVITTPVGGNPEIVIDKETGTLILPEDSERLAEAIIYHLENPELSKRMGEKGQERVKKYFSLAQMLNKVMDIYKIVLGRI
ncbi:MAG: glycosyltransferase family 4 protein [Candidatus Omnitrophota bacterium]|nr:glycosyltransferase family 4 protein [Candidatus Omnitrophota bacterium]